MSKVPHRARLSPDMRRVLALVQKPGTVNRAYQLQPEVVRTQV